MFSGFPSVNVCVPPCVHECVWTCVLKSLLARCLTNPWTEFHQNLVVGAVEAKDGVSLVKVKVAARSYMQKMCEPIIPYLLNGLKDQSKI